MAAAENGAFDRFAALAPDSEDARHGKGRFSNGSNRYSVGGDRYSGGGDRYSGGGKKDGKGNNFGGGQFTNHFDNRKSGGSKAGDGKGRPSRGSVSSGQSGEDANTSFNSEEATSPDAAKRRAKDDIYDEVGVACEASRGLLERRDFDGQIRQFLHAIHGLGGRQKVKECMVIVQLGTQRKSRASMRNPSAFIVTLIRRFFDLVSAEAREARMKDYAARSGQEDGQTSPELGPTESRMERQVSPFEDDDNDDPRYIVPKRVHVAQLVDADSHFECACFICKHVVEEAVVLPCSHLFCRSCLKNKFDWEGRSSAPCPVCSATFTKEYVAGEPTGAFIQRYINNLQISCVFAEKHIENTEDGPLAEGHVARELSLACEWVGTVGNYGKHIKKECSCAKKLRQLKATSMPTDNTLEEPPLPHPSHAAATHPGTAAPAMAAPGQAPATRPPTAPPVAPPSMAPTAMASMSSTAPVQPPRQTPDASMRVPPPQGMPYAGQSPTAPPIRAPMMSAAQAAAAAKAGYKGGGKENGFDPSLLQGKGGGGAMPSPELAALLGLMDQGKGGFPGGAGGDPAALAAALAALQQQQQAAKGGKGGGMDRATLEAAMRQLQLAGSVRPPNPNMEHLAEAYLAAQERSAAQYGHQNPLDRRLDDEEELQQMLQRMSPPERERFVQHLRQVREQQNIQNLDRLVQQAQEETRVKLQQQQRQQQQQQQQLLLQHQQQQQRLAQQQQRELQQRQQQLQQQARAQAADGGPPPTDGEAPQTGDYFVTTAWRPPQDQSRQQSGGLPVQRGERVYVSRASPQGWSFARLVDPERGRAADGWVPSQALCRQVFTVTTPFKEERSDRSLLSMTPGERVVVYHRESGGWVYGAKVSMDNKISPSVAGWFPEWALEEPM